MQRRATHTVKPHDVGGFTHNKRQQFVHLVGLRPAVVTLCGRPVDVVIPLDAFRRLDWTQVCPTCQDGCPGFLAHWREHHQPLPY